ncbi:sugar ABC transporter substrate-binding protein [bacterium]|nr:sugar ABC transporter substrate-binding protein [bacterium]
MKKFLICLVFILFLCGCAPKDNRTVVQFASWGSKSEIDILKPILSDFEKENPDIKVDFMHIPQNYFQKIHLLFASNTAPDVIFINNLYLPVYANAGVLEEFELANTPSPDGEGWNGVMYLQALNALSWNDKLYAIPRDVSNLIIFYNKDMFREKGIPYPTSDWTLDDFLKIAQKLSGNGVFGINFEENPMLYLPYFMSNGGGILPDEIDKPESQKSLRFYADLRNKYHVAPKKSESASATMAQMFLQKRLGMYLSGRWMVPKFREECTFDWDVINFPNGESGSVVPMDASGWAVTKSSKHKKEAFMLVEYLASKSSSERFTSSGLIVPARKDTAYAILDGKKPKNAKAFLDIIQTSKPTPTTVNYNEITDNLKQKNEKLFNE